MSTENFNVQNVKCGGCASNIKTNLTPMDGITAIEVDIENGQVCVSGTDLSRTTIADKLTELGYPAA